MVTVATKLSTKWGLPDRPDSKVSSDAEKGFRSAWAFQRSRRAFVTSPAGIRRADGP
jgi:hypothetical protein